MFKKYKDLFIQLGVSLTLFIVIMALTLIKTPLQTIFVALSVFLGTFILDLDYIFYAYFLEKDKSFSKSLRGFIKHFDLGNIINHIQYHKGDVEDKTLNSAIFQVLLAGITIIAASSNSGIVVKALILSTFTNSIYRLTDYYFDGQAKDWFWSLKKLPTEREVLYYGLALVAVLAYSLSLL